MILHMVTCNRKNNQTYKLNFCFVLYVCAMAVSLHTQPALDDIHVVISVMSRQQLIIRWAASQENACMVLTHGDEVLLSHTRAAGMVMCQFTYGVAD